MTGVFELQASMLPRDRPGPYGLVGWVSGRSRPNPINASPDPISHDVGAFSLGGGIQGPFREHASFFADARLTIGSEAGELLAYLPVRAGVRWRF